MRKRDADVAFAENIARGEDAEEQAAGREDAMDFAQHGIEIVDMLHYLIVDHQAERCVGEGEPPVVDLMDRAAAGTGAGAGVKDVGAAEGQSRGDSGVDQSAWAAAEIEDARAGVLARETLSE